MTVAEARFARRGAVRVSVVTADRQPLYRQAVVHAVRRRPELELVGEAADGRGALEAIVSLEPQVAVLDLKLPALDGEKILNAVARDGVPTKIIFLSADSDSASVYRAIAGGAAGYLTKDVDAEQLCDAISAVARGSTVLAPELQSGIAGEIRMRAVGERPVLSERESEILKLIANGLSAPQIATRIHLGTATVKTHLQHIYEKLGVSERPAAVAEAMRRGLLE